MLAVVREVLRDGQFLVTHSARILFQKLLWFGLAIALELAQGLGLPEFGMSLESSRELAGHVCALS